jgi:hypothetical protein
VTKGSFEASTFKDVTFGMLLLYHFKSVCKEKKEEEEDFISDGGKEEACEKPVGIGVGDDQFCMDCSVTTRQLTILLLRPESTLDLQLNGSVEVERVLRVVMMTTRDDYPRDIARNLLSPHLPGARRGRREFQFTTQQGRGGPFR